MAWTQTDLDNINSAISSGALEVRFSDRTIRYQTTSDLIKARLMIEDELAAPNSTPFIRQHRVIPSDGF
jgi:hypothetical protein